MKRALSVLILLIVTAPPALAQLDGARVYWPLPKNFNVMAVHKVSGTVNATWINFNRIQPGVDIENELYLFSYTRSQPTLGRSAVYTVVLPTGTIKTDSPLSLSTNDRFVHGVGDPSLSATFNVFGTPGLMLREYARYDHHTSVALGVRASFPVGQYEETEPLNMGSNQLKVRTSLPVVHAIGPWVPGKRTTVEIAPSFTWLADNTDSQGETVEQDALVSVETHVTRDVTRKAFLSLDYSYLRFGETTSRDNATGAVTGMSETRNAHLLGGTAGFQINDNLFLYVTHMQTLAPDSGSLVLEGALSRMTLTWSWHPVIEDRRALGD